MVDNIEERLLGTEEDHSDLKWRIWVESKKIWRVAAPAILARVTSFGILVVTQCFIGHISELDLAALNVSTWEINMFFGFLGAACVRIANELGRGDAKAVKFSIKVILSTSIILGLVFFILCLIFSHNIGYLFTSNEEVAKTVAELSMLLAFTLLFNSIQPVLSGVAVGAGLQGTVAIINLCCYYVIGVPIGCLLAYVADLEVKGIWIGMLSGMGMQILALALMLWRTDWDLQVNKASERLGRWFLKPSEEPDESLNHA
ncbi:hypothetical protein Vadar_010688 [Vaccinium darrowii]|uniref:Uncharacterized protein n=1 Tax=Vaccinium darrowii TaxID=229202 RepID=A0ACB7YKX0_9ERIC|nr:hypothetical protein Vadar_010688 [Vaccinium darrowii]